MATPIETVILWALIISGEPRVQEVYRTEEPCVRAARSHRAQGTFAYCMPTNQFTVETSTHQLRSLGVLLND
jgi:hypothetical protein